MSSPRNLPKRKRFTIEQLGKAKLYAIEISATLSVILVMVKIIETELHILFR